MQDSSNHLEKEGANYIGPINVTQSHTHTKKYFSRLAFFCKKYDKHISITSQAKKNFIERRLCLKIQKL